jgi:beta-glucosidase
MGAYAIVDILSGAVNPSGKLVNQWAQGVGEVGSGAEPWLARRVAKWVANGRSAADPTDGRVYDPYVSSIYGSQSGLPLFRFGHGLSYTTFKYQSFVVDIITQPGSTIPYSGRGRVGYLDALNTIVLNVNVTICNTGTMDGVEVVQVYSQDPSGAFNTPIVPYWKRLIGYGRLFLNAGQCNTITISILADDIALYDDQMTLRLVPGTYIISTGTSSNTDFLQQNVTLM